MSEISTRIWLEERLWDAVTNLAIREGTTVRELLPRLISRSLTEPYAGSGQPTFHLEESGPSAPGPAAEPGPPVAVLAEVYRCNECGAQIKLAGLSAHLGKHLRERQASEAERS